MLFSRGLSAGIDTLHLYVGGDGSAFVDRHRVAADPTPRRPLTLQLMLADPAPSVYVGRPCYHGAGPPPACDPRLWTSARYSAAVVTSVAAVIADLAARFGTARVTVIGYSGGGVIALLSAARVARVATVVTLAAPLDVAAWTEAHGYTPLRQSLDPAAEADWPADLRQVHLQGERDRNVPPATLARFRDTLARGGVEAEFRVLAGFDHHCCWLDSWPALLSAALPPAGGNEPASGAKL